MEPTSEKPGAALLGWSSDCQSVGNVRTMKDYLDE
jgi:hypothetical protein